MKNTLKKIVGNRKLRLLFDLLLFSWLTTLIVRSHGWPHPLTWFFMLLLAVGSFFAGQLWNIRSVVELKEEALEILKTKKETREKLAAIERLLGTALKESYEEENGNGHKYKM